MWTCFASQLPCFVMKRPTIKPFQQLLRLGLGIFRTPAQPGQFVLALAYGALCHSAFVAAVIAIFVAMFYGMSESFGTVPAPWSIVVNLALILQSPPCTLSYCQNVAARGLCGLPPSVMDLCWPQRPMQSSHHCNYWRFSHFGRRLDHLVAG